MIGVFDSGLGGLSVLAAIARRLPDADLVYFADSAYLPYGDKTAAFIRSRVLTIGRFLVDQGCRSLVVACNTATAAAVSELRASLPPDIPVVGVEPGVKPAALSSRTRRIAVLVTAATARSERLRQLISNHTKGVAVRVVPCPGWATRIETLHLDAPEFVDEIRAIVLPLLDEGIDRLVLGCTHYTFLRLQLQPLIVGRAELVDVAAAVAEQVARSAVHQLQYGTGRLELFASANSQRLVEALPRLGLHNLVARLTRDQQISNSADLLVA